MLILHGENLVASRTALGQKIAAGKSKGHEIIKLSGTEISFTAIKQALESLSMFSSNRLVILENFLSSSKSLEREKILDFIKKGAFANLILWEGKKIDGRTLTSLKAQTLSFDLSPLIFRFLDSLAPDNQKNSIYWFHQCLAQDPPELIFYMLTRQIRLLILAADLGSGGLTGMPEWRKGKLISQAKKFGLKKLLELYRQLLEIDYQQKTGQTPFNLTSQLDLFLASL